MVLIGSYPLLRFRRARITELGAYLIFAAYIFLAVRWSICYELFTIAPTDGGNLAGMKAVIGT